MPDPESIAVFDMKKQSIQTVAIGRAFGLYNFYQDALHTQNMHHLEEKLSLLEGKASQIIADLHKAAARPGNQNFTLLRRDLQTLRRFLFIMHYRSSAIEKTYFQEDHPRNVSVRSWIRKLKVDNEFTNDKQIWLRGLQYYLDTNHNDILAHAAELSSRNPEIVISHSELNADTPSEHWFAAAYETFTNNYYMGIWQANDNAEFVLGHNSYGLWEGTVSGRIPQLFRIYVLSPAITLVLKLNITKDPIFRAMESSTLGNHPLQFPRTKYDRPPPEFANPRARESQLYDALQRHLQSTKAASDQFTFTINSLSADQTYLVNQVVLENLHADGTLVFRSKDHMLSTARKYDSAEGPFRKENRNSIAALAACLSSPDQAATPPENSVQPSPLAQSVSTPSAMRPRLFLLDKAFHSSVGCPVSEYDLAFDDMLRDILEGSIEFRSCYDRARYIYRLLPKKQESTHPLALLVHRQMLRSSRYIEVMVAAMDLSEMPASATKYVLVESIDGDSGTHLLNIVAMHLEMWEKDWTAKEPEADEDFRVAKEVIALAYLQLLVDADYRLAHSICNSIVFTMPSSTSCEPVEQSLPIVQAAPSSPAISFQGESRAKGGPEQSSADENEPLESVGGEEVSQAFIEEIVESDDAIDMDTLRENKLPDLSVESASTGGISRDKQSGMPVENKAPPSAGVLTTMIVQLLFGSLVHLAAAIPSFILELVDELWRAIWGGVPRRETTVPENVIFAAPAFVGHLFMTVTCLYGALYLTGALLFRLPVMYRSPVGSR